MDRKDTAKSSCGCMDTLGEGRGIRAKKSSGGSKGDGLLVPPFNFACVEAGVFRAGFPNRRNFSFLETLNLKTIA